MMLYTSGQCWELCVTWFHSFITILVIANTLMVYDLWRRNRPRH